LSGNAGKATGKFTGNEIGCTGNVGKLFILTSPINVD